MIDERYPEGDTFPWPDDFIQGFAWADAMKALNAESIRGRVLLAAHFMDNLLLLALKGFLLEGEAAEKLLTGFNAPLGTFSAKITACSALGLITSDEHRAIDAFRDVRNEFAHSITPDLTTGKARGGLDRLATLFSLPNTGDVEMLIDLSIFNIVPTLLNRGEHAETRRLKVGEWSISRPSQKELNEARTPN